MSTAELVDGYYLDLPHKEYHGLSRMSHSDAVRLTGEQWCPAKFKYWRDHRVPDDQHSRDFDIGQALHTLVFGVGPGIVVLDTGQTRAAKKVQKLCAEAYEQNLIPLTPSEHELVVGTCEAVMASPEARMLVTGGEPEVSFMWTDPDTNIECKGRADYIKTVGGRRVVVDLKSTDRGDVRGFQRDCAKYGYPQQADWYLRGLTSVGEADSKTVFVFVAVEKVDPFVVSTFQLASTAVGAAGVLNDRALWTYKECSESDTWPGFTDKVTMLDMPTWWIDSAQIVRS